MTICMNYDSMFMVIESWEKLRRVTNYEEVAGSMLFQRLFEKCAPIKVLFGFPEDIDPASEELLADPKFLRHGTYLIQMLDKAMNLLGPDIELLGEILEELGKKHAKFGVKSEYFPVMEKALLETLSILLKDSWSDEMYEGWVAVYRALATELCRAMEKEKAVLESWAKLKQMKNYEEVVGSTLFQRMFEKCPDSKTLFGFPLDMDPKCDEMLTSRRFKMHSSYFIEMLDTALNMLEKDKLEENLAELGKMHVQHGVKQEYFPHMGEALIFTLKSTLKDDFDAKLEKSWNDIYRQLSVQMRRAMNAEDDIQKDLERNRTV